MFIDQCKTLTCIIDQCKTLTCTAASSPYSCVRSRARISKLYMQVRVYTYMVRMCVCVCVRAPYAPVVGQDDVAPRVELQHHMARAFPHAEAEADDAVGAQLCWCV